MLQQVVNSTMPYVQTVLLAASAGDVSAISILLFSLLFFIYLSNKITSLFMPLLKPIMLLIVIADSLYFLATSVLSDYYAYGLTTRVVVVGSTFFLTALLAMYFLFDELMRALEETRGISSVEKSESDKKPEMTGHDLKEMATDKKLWSLLLYLLITEFGVFSSKTITAPSEYSGLIVFATFVMLSFVFVFQFYENPKEGLLYLSIAYVVGGVVSILLGVLWGGYSLSQLLSMEYFKSDAAVALMSGVAVSLFMNR